MPLVLITTDHLRPGGEVDVLLTAAGHRIRHLPQTGVRNVDDLVAALDGVEGAIIANEPMTADVLGRATSLRAVVPLARAFGMTVLCTTNVPEEQRTDAAVRFVDFGALLRESDYVSMHTALTPRTRNLAYSHLAGQTAEARHAAAVGAARELVAALDGEPRTSVNAHLITAARTPGHLHGAP